MSAKIFPALSLILIISISVFANENPESSSVKAVSTNPAESQQAIKKLRLMNQKGLDDLLKTHQEEIENFKQTGVITPLWQRISHAIDRVARQKDAYSSGLFWHTDLEKAQIESKKTGKPILSLRLLGNLDEEYSCANSRFFRSILYSNAKISQYLRENYVLHWKSVRPAPKITIDFGDGRKLVRTITGNSIHYILDEKGLILDALPGLYNPKDFYKYLIEINNFKQRNGNNNYSWKLPYRTIRRNNLLLKWKKDLEELGISDLNTSIKPDLNPSIITSGKTPVRKNSEPEKKPTALSAAPRAVTKALVEMPMVKSITIDSEVLKENTTFGEWKIFAGPSGKVWIDQNSRQFIRRKSTGGETISEKEFAGLIANLQKYVAIDTVQNEYVFHTKIFQWLNENPEIDVETFNDRVYSELFLTPKSDKWLGLYSPDIYSAIENNGVIK